MAGSMNLVILIGNLGKDPEVRQAGTGTVAELRLATSFEYTDRGGQKQEETEWHTVICWNKTAELCERYLHKGRKIKVEGRLKTRDWVDQDSGQKRYKTEIVARDVAFLDSKADHQGQGPPRQQQEQERQPRQQQRSRRQDPPTGAVGPASNPYRDDDVPF